VRPSSFSGTKDESTEDIRRHWLEQRANVPAMPRKKSTEAVVSTHTLPSSATANNDSLKDDRSSRSVIRYIDLFCGIGGFRFAAEAALPKAGLVAECLFSSDIDVDCQKAYAANFGEVPIGDITRVSTDQIPLHDLLLAGFPCQPFSIMGKRRGFDDTRGTLFFDIARIIEAKKPSAFVLENVKLLVGHNGGRTLKRILETLSDLGYSVESRVLNALSFGLPHKRERIWIVGHRVDKGKVNWPVGGLKMKPLSAILEKDVPASFFASEHIRNRRHALMRPGATPTIWHENKAGHVSAHPYSCALRAGASYNYLLVDGVRRLTPREMLRLQGFPEKFIIVCTDSQTRKQAGNSLPVNVAEAVISGLIAGLGWGKSVAVYPESGEACGMQLSLMEKKGRYHVRTTSTKRR
jgi:DNA (cytosine-5)-methyltransferase 1